MMISAKKNSHSMKFGMAVFFWGDGEYSFFDFLCNNHPKNT